MTGADRSTLRLVILVRGYVDASVEHFSAMLADERSVDECAGVQLESDFVADVRAIADQMINSRLQGLPGADRVCFEDLLDGHSELDELRS